MSGGEGSSRGESVRALLAWLNTACRADDLFPRRPAPRAMEIVYGCIRMDRSLDWLIGRLADRPPSKPVQACLKTGLYELFWMERAEAYGVVDTLVDLATGYGGKRAGGFVNAVLRRAIRERDRWKADWDAQPPGVRFSHPDALIDRWTAAYGREAALAVCEWNNRPAEVAIRLPRDPSAREDFRRGLEEAGLRVEPHPASEEYAILPRGAAVESLPGADRVLAVVQDPAGRHAVDLLDPRPGQTILDACAAPGGKALDIAARMEGRGRLDAADVQAPRVARLRDAVARNGARHVEVLCADVRELNRSGYDAALLDVPCTNTGVLRRRPDARWRFSADRLRRIRRLQDEILDAGWARVRPGGAVVYSTCSLEPEENEGAVRAFLARRPGAELEEERTSRPWRDAADGAYAARLRKEASP